MKNQKEISNLLLFSIDFEDIRLLVPDGMKYKETLPSMVYQYLEFLRETNSRATFFIVGDTVSLYKSLIQEIISEGHEIGCHTHTHLPLNLHTRESLRDDLKKNLDALYQVGASEVRGFRAPMLSLTAETSWAYEVLEELGFSYSSSVMATKSAFHSWPEFGEDFKLMNGKIWELPPTLLPFKNFSIPFASSVYFRFLPGFVSAYAFNRKFKEGTPVISYFHPFDIDYKQERFMHPGVNGNLLFNFLMYYNRKGMLKKFKRALPKNYNIIPHGEYVNTFLQKEQITFPKPELSSIL